MQLGGTYKIQVLVNMILQGSVLLINSATHAQHWLPVNLQYMFTLIQINLMKTPELIIVTMMVVSHIDTTHVTHSLHKGLILCIEGMLSSIVVHDNSSRFTYSYSYAVDNLKIVI